MPRDSNSHEWDVSQTGSDADRTVKPSRRTFMKTVGATVGAGLVGLGTDSAAAAAVGELTSRADATHVATSSGRWADPGIWDARTTPGDEARVWIDDGVTVTIDHQDSARLHWVFVAGELRFEPTVDTALNVDSLITGESSTIEIGTASNPVGPDRTAEITFIDRGPIDEGWDPDRKSRGLMTMGDVRIYGAEKTAHTTLAQHPTAGDGQLQLHCISQRPTGRATGAASST